MVQAIENRAQVEGEVRRVETDTARPGHARVTIRVGNVRPVGGFPNLFKDALGGDLDVVLPQDAAQNLRVGTRVHGWIRRASPFTVVGEDFAPHKN